MYSFDIQDSFKSPSKTTSLVKIRKFTVISFKTLGKKFNAGNIGLLIRENTSLIYQLFVKQKYISDDLNLSSKFLHVIKTDNSVVIKFISKLSA